MDTGYYKFYEKKYKIMFWFLVFAITTAVLVWARNESTDPREMFFLALAIIFMGLASIVTFVKLFSSKAYIEITPVYIKMPKFEPLFWTDITCAKEIKVPHDGSYMWAFEVKDISKYKLTKSQKVNLQFNFPPFAFSVFLLSKKDRQKLKEILQSRIADCRLDQEFNF